MHNSIQQNGQGCLVCALERVVTLDFAQFLIASVSHFHDILSPDFQALCRIDGCCCNMETRENLSKYALCLLWPLKRAMPDPTGK